MAVNSAERLIVFRWVLLEPAAADPAGMSGSPDLTSDTNRFLFESGKHTQSQFEF